ncbi:MAG: Universal stress protein UspA-like nucleotide-binding protein [Variovorax sp.]|nr:Universal stress protein UspA-like nucleotide-binding protein [Variovorax sp.]
MKVLIGFDGSDSAKAAIQGLHRAGLPLNTEALVVFVSDSWPPPPRGDYPPGSFESAWQDSPLVKKANALAATALTEAETLATAGEALVKKEFPGWRVSHAAHGGSPYLSLIKLAEGAPDLVVVGSQGKSALGRFMLGSVSQNVLTHASCSVRVSRDNNEVARRSDEPVRIILGVDGSTHSALAVSAVAGRTWPARTEVKVVAALDTKFWSLLANPASSAWAAAWAYVGDGDEDGQSWASRAVNSVVEELQSAGLVATSFVEEGDPKRVLLEVAERWKADCIFIGAKGHGGLDRFLLGSVSAAVAARAGCSVEVVRQG